MSDRISFTVLGKPAPQGSMKPFMCKGRPRMRSQLTATMPWRQQVGQMALFARNEAGIHEIFAGRHVPVSVTRDCYFERPASIPKTRTRPATAPDEDKLARAINDAMAGILYVNDGQIVESTTRKLYGLPERAEITVTRLQ